MTTHGQYNGCHKWLRYNYGKASRCENSVCTGKSKTYHWALKKGKDHARVRSHYKQLCELCHRKYDIVKSAKEKPVPFLVRLYKAERRIIEKKARALDLSEAEVIRRAITTYL